MRRHAGFGYAALAATLLAASAVLGQPMSRRATTVAAVKAFPGFFNGQQVLVRAELQQTEQRASLVSGDDTIPAFVRAGAVSGSGPLEIRGDVLDIGRMQPEDPRLTGKDLRSLLGVEPTDSWPRPGELVVLNVTSASPAETLAAPSVRNIALAPDRYLDQRVTVQGQFRGRNLFADLPQAPAGGDGRREFVIRSADAAIWVTGKQPKGRGFNFDINSRLDTRRWVEVSGVVKSERGLVWIVAEEIAETSPQAEARPEQVTEKPPPIPPEVLFSAPTADETDVPLDTSVRIQFSRDLDPETLKGHVRAFYSSAQATERGEPQAPRLPAKLTYDRGTRVLEISFEQPLERFRVLTVELGEGITGTDGAPLKPWSVTFTLGG